MKLKTLLLCGGMVAATSSQAALTVTERPHPVLGELPTLPVPQQSAVPLDGTAFYLYNVGLQSYFAGANNWQTRATALADYGFKVRFTPTNDGLYALEDSCEKFSAWKRTFANNSTDIWVDSDISATSKNEALWGVNVNADGTFTITNTKAFADGVFGGVAGDIGTVGQNEAVAIGTYLNLYTSTTVGFNSVWYAVSQADFEANVAERAEKMTAYNEARDAAVVTYRAELETYNKFKPLFDALYEADKLGVTGLSDYEAVYAKDDATADELNTATEAVKQAIVDFNAAQASVASPMDMTSMITNPDFAENKGTGWSGTGFAFQSYANAEHYNKTYDTYQNIKGMPAGVYALTMQGYYRAGDTSASWSNFKSGAEKNALLYAINKKADEAANDTLTSAIMNVYNGIAPNNSLGVEERTAVEGDDTYYIPFIMQAAKAYFDAGYYKDNKVLFAVSEGSAQIGVKKSKTVGSDWSMFNNFALTYYGSGADAYQLWNDDMTKNAPEYSFDDLVTITAVDDYNTAVAAANKAASYEDVMANIAAIDAAVETIEANAAAWRAYQAAIESAQSVTGNESYQGQDVMDLADYLDLDAVDILANKEYSTEEVLAETVKLKELTDNAVQNSITPGTDFSDRLVNTDFAQGETGWTFKKASGGNVRADAGAKCAEGWNNADFDIYQEVANAPVGVYEISVQGFYRKGRGDAAWKFYFNAETGEPLEKLPEVPAFVYLNDNKTPLSNVFEYKVFNDPQEGGEKTYYTGDFYTDAFNYTFPNNMADAGLAFDHGAYKVSAFGLVAQKGDALRIGVKGNTTQENDSWAIFTRFKLTYQGMKAEYVKPELEKALAALETNLAQEFGTDVKAAMVEGQKAGQEAIADGDGTVMFKALSQIFANNTKMDASLAIFDKLTAALDDLEAYMPDAPADAAAKGETEIFISETRNAKASYTDAQAQEALDKIPAFRAKLALPAGYENATDAEPVDMTGLILTPSFEKDGTNSVYGWQGATGYNFGNDDALKAALAIEYFEKDFDMYQEIDVPNGMYQLQVSAFDRYKDAASDYDQYNTGVASLASLYAQTGEKEVAKPVEHLASDINASVEPMGIGSETTYTNADGEVFNVPNCMTSARAYFDMGKYLNGLNIKVENGKLRIGIKQEKHEGGCWVIMDDFKLYYLGTASTAKEEGFNDVKGVEESDADAKVEIFSANGMKVGSMQSGVNVVVTTDAKGNVKTKKVIK